MTSSRPGPGSAITPAPAICMPARAPWSSATAEQFRQSEAALRELPGIGPYTAAAIAAIAYDAPTTPVDGNVERVIARLYAVATPLPAAKAGDFPAGAGADAGAPRRRFRPSHDGSRRHHLHAEEAGLRAVPLEAKLRGASARARPKRFRAARRSAKASCAAAPPSSRAAPTVLCSCARGRRNGLLGGMTEVPTTEWVADFDEAKRLVARHDFFHLSPPGRGRFGGAAFPAWCGTCSRTFRSNSPSIEPTLRRARRRPRACAGSRFRELGGEALPSLMRKVVAHALDRGRHTSPRARGQGTRKDRS